MLWATDAGFITDQDQISAMGCVVVQEKARVAGTASLPLPISNLGDDSWFVHQPMLGFTEASSGVDLVTGHQVDIDSKAQRKVTDGESIVFLVENLGSDTIQFAMIARMLVKLH